MRFQKSIFLVFLLLTGATGLRAQWVPVSAKMRQTVETIEDGKITKVEQKEGNFYRNFDGSILKYWTKINGDEKLGGSGELYDNKSLFHYSMNMKTKQALQLGRGLRPLTPDDWQSASPSPKREEVVEGIRCQLHEVFIKWPDGRREPSGERCDSSMYALTLREDRRGTQNGVTRHTVFELYDIKLGVEPDAKLFDLVLRCLD